MAMTKKEQAAMQAAIDRAETLAALRWSSPVSRDVLPPDCGWKPGDARYTEGWDFNAYSRQVYQAWSSSIHHGRGAAPVSQKYGSASQNPIALYSTQAKALAAMRHECELKAARELMAIDRLIADLERK